jgi:hypothetical protein
MAANHRFKGQIVNNRTACSKSDVIDKKKDITQADHDKAAEGASR